MMRSESEAVTATPAAPPPLLLNIADLIVAIDADNGATRQQLLERYADFCCGNAAASTQAHVSLRVATQAGFKALPIRPGTNWETAIAYEGDRVRYASYLEEGWFSLERGEGSVLRAPEASLENFLRVLYAGLALRHAGLLLHGAGVVHRGRGYVFFGPSGAGKTTITRLSAESDQVLSDDLVIIRPRNGHYHLYGVPFRGELEAIRTNASAPLAGVYRLRQSSTHRIGEMPRPAAVAELAGSAPFVADSALSSVLLDRCDQLVRAVPVRTLHFRRDNRFWEVIDAACDAVS